MRLESFRIKNFRSISANMPTSTDEAARAAWLWLAKEITSDPALQQMLALQNADIPALAFQCEKELEAGKPVLIHLKRIISISASTVKYGKAPT